MVFPSHLVGLALALLTRKGGLIKEPPFRALAQMSGADSSIESPRVVTIADEGAWEQLWREHHTSFQLGARPSGQDDALDRPRVDFANSAVLCLFGGQSKNIGSFRVADSGVANNLAYVRVSPIPLPNSGTVIVQNPFIFIIVPRTRRKIVVQLDQTPLGGEGWRTLATLAPIQN